MKPVFAGFTSSKSCPSLSTISARADSFAPSAASIVEIERCVRVVAPFVSSKAVPAIATASSPNLNSRIFASPTAPPGSTTPASVRIDFAACDRVPCATSFCAMLFESSTATTVTRSVTTGGISSSREGCSNRASTSATPSSRKTSSAAFCARLKRDPARV